MQTRKFYEIARRSQIVSLDGNQVKDVWCSCEDFNYRKLKKINNCLFVTDLCKHLKTLFHYNNQWILSLKKEAKLLGLINLTEKQKIVLREMCEFTCQNCYKHEKEVGKLEIHRIIRSESGGRYIPSNCKLLCNNCHKLFHSNEFK